MSAGPNAKAEQEEMDEVIPWWRHNFIEEFGALSEKVVVENTEDANFVGGTEQDRKLVKERVQVRKMYICLVVAIAPSVTCVAAHRVPQDVVAAQVITRRRFSQNTRLSLNFDS